MKRLLCAALLLSMGCGKTDSVETIRGPKGDKGENGANGQNGADGRDGKDGEIVYTPAPQPTPQPTSTNMPPTFPYPPIIIINNNTCTRLTCPQNTIVVCACIDGFWQSVSVAPYDVQKLRIKNYGYCTNQGTQQVNDCFWIPSRPQPQPTQTTVPVPPVPTTQC
jgi:hypothetical protein